MKPIVPTTMNEAKSSLDSWKSAFTSTFKQLVEKGKELQQVTEQLFIPQYAKEFPRMDLVEGENEIFVVFELPGLPKEDFQLEIGGGLLFLKGEKRNPLQKKAVGIHLAECGYGKFERTVSLPYKVDEEKVEADFSNGVLTVTLHKLEGQTHQRHPIKVR